MKKHLSKIYSLVLWGILISPSLVRAWSPGQALVPNCGGPCGFSDAITLINNLLDFFIYLAIPISVILFAWVGWTYISEGGNSGKRAEANARMVALGKGVFFTMAAWLIVKTILTGLGASGVNILG